MLGLGLRSESEGARGEGRAGRRGRSNSPVKLVTRYYLEEESIDKKKTFPFIFSYYLCSFMFSYYIFTLFFFQLYILA